MLAILTTHPIQYQIPIWQELARRKRVDFEVWYLSDQGARQTKDKEFGQVFQWDLDMLEGYPHRFLDTQPTPPNLSTFRGARLGSLTTLFQEKNVTALWINGWQVQAYWQAAFQAHRCGIPVWLRGESNDLRQASGLKSTLKKAILNQLFRRISCFLYIGSANKRLYESFGVPDDKMISAPYCVDNERFARAAHEWRPKRADLRHTWNVPEGAMCFLFCGKFIPKKRPLDILEAAWRLMEENSALRDGKVHILMAGDGELRGELEAKARGLEVLCGRPVVTFIGFLNQTEVPKAYVAADCLILASDTGETWGLVVNEALACGTPAIVSDHCGCAEDLAQPLGSDFVYNCGDVRGLADRMGRRLNKKLQLVDVKTYFDLIEQFSIAKTVDVAVTFSP